LVLTSIIWCRRS